MTMNAEAAASPDLSSFSGDEWILLGEGNANVVFSYGGRDPALSGLVLRVRKTKAKTQTELDRAVDAIIWAQLDEKSSPHSSAADRDAAFARDVVAPLLGPQYLLLPRVVAVPRGLRESLEEQLARKGRESRKRKEPGGGTGSGSGGGGKGGPTLEERGALLRNATRWEEEDEEEKKSGSGPAAVSSFSSSLCVELKPKCGLPHGTGRRTKVRLKQQQQQQIQQQASSSSTSSPSHKSRYCPSDLFSGEAARRRRALEALLSDALARDFSHSAPRAAHFRLFDERGEPLEGTARAERAVSELLLVSPASGGGGGAPAARRPLSSSSSSSSSSSTFKLLVGALDSILSFEPLLPRLLEAQRCPECLTAAVAAESLSALREAAAKKEKPPPSSKASSPPSPAAVSAAASALRSYLVATSARDLSVMILLRRGGGGGGGNRDAKKGGEERTFLQRHAEASSSASAASGGAVKLRGASSSILRYRIALCDLDAKPSSKAELHAAADERLPRSGARRRGEK